MGWASSADYMQGTNVKFNTKEDAIHFCEKQGESPPLCSLGAVEGGARSDPACFRPDCAFRP